MNLLDALLSGFRCWRRLRRGHWERWWVEPCRANVWAHYAVCHRAAGTRPGACWGPPVCEHYP